MKWPRRVLTTPPRPWDQPEGEGDPMASLTSQPRPVKPAPAEKVATFNVYAGHRHDYLTRLGHFQAGSAVELFDGVMEALASPRARYAGKLGFTLTVLTCRPTYSGV